MKGSSYETGLGKARSGRKWAQGLREGPSPQVGPGEARRSNTWGQVSTTCGTSCREKGWCQGLGGS